MQTFIKQLLIIIVKTSNIQTESYKKTSNRWAKWHKMSKQTKYIFGKQ